MGRLQMIKTEKDEDFRFGKVLLVKEHWLGRKMQPVDATDGKDFPDIVAMKLFIEEDGQYHEIDVDNITCRSLRKGLIHFEAKEAS
jgi:hypothetical protein